MTTTLSSQEFNQRAYEAQQAASKGPVFITEQGQPAHVLMDFATYQRLTRQCRSIVDALAIPEVDEVDFEPPRMGIGCQPVDLS